MWRNRNAYILLTGLHNGIAAMEYEVSKKKYNHHMIWQFYFQMDTRELKVES